MNAPVTLPDAWRHQSRARQPLDNRRDARLGVLRVFIVQECTVLGTGPQLDDVVKAEGAAADRASMRNSRRDSGHMSSSAPRPIQ